MKNNIKKNGSLLLELLIVIGVVAIITPLIAQVVVSSLNMNKWSVENKTAASLADEELQAIDNISFEKWQNIYNKIKLSSSHYYALKNNGSWSVSLGEENKIINGVDYLRYFTITDVCRDNTSDIIITASSTPPCPVGSKADPSVQKVTVIVSWRNGSLSKDYYLTRWRNQVCLQTDWSGIGSGPVACPSSVYDSATAIDLTSVPGSIKLQAN